MDMADMDKLMEFLQKEVPSNACDLNNSISSTLEIIERTRAAVIGSVPKLYQKGRHDEVNNFTDADRLLMNMENYLKDFIHDIPSIQQKQVEPSNTKTKSTDIKQKLDYNSCKVDDSKPYSLDADFSKKRPVAFTFEEKRYDVQSWKRFIVMVCELLNDKNSKLFQSFPEDNSMQGRTRKYFIRESSPYHKKVAGTGIWVLTNNDGSANCRIIIKMFEKYDIPITSMKIFIQSDYSLRDEENDDIILSEKEKKTRCRKTRNKN